MENFANEFVSKLDGKISDEALRTVLQELQATGFTWWQKRLRACLQNP